MTPTAEYSKRLAEKGVLEMQLKILETQLKALEPDVLSWFQAQGVDSARLEDGRTLYLRRELYAGKETGVDDELLVRALEAEGLGQFVAPKLNHSRLSAWARELDREGTPLPAALAGIVTVREVFKVGHRKAATNGESGE